MNEDYNKTNEQNNVPDIWKLEKIWKKIKN